MQSKRHRQLLEDFQGVGVPTDMISSLHEAQMDPFPYTNACWTPLSQPLQQLEALPNATIDTGGSRSWGRNSP